MNDELPYISSLLKVAENNDHLIIADIAHKDDSKMDAITNQLQDMHNKGYTTIALEVDPKDRENADGVFVGDGGYERMAREANRLGMTIFLYDDRNRQMERDRKYPVEANFLNNHLGEPALIESSPNPEKMEQYITEINNNWNDDVKFRNGKMIDNLDSYMKTHPNEKVMVILGEQHTWSKDDVDEGLRARGHQVAVVEVNSKKSYIDREGAVDLPDMVISAESDKVIAYKDKSNGTMKKALEGIEIPWRNTEPIADVSRSNLCNFSPDNAGCKKRGIEGPTPP